MNDWLNLSDIRPLRWRDVVRLLDTDDLLQIAIAITSLAAITMVSSTGPLHRWGFVVSLVFQPLWIIANWRAKQWGMFALAVFYLGVWTQGILNRFF